MGFTKEQFHYAFANTLSREDSTRSTSATTSPRRAASLGRALANFTPGHQDTYVDFRNEDRAPLLFIAGGEDN